NITTAHAGGPVPGDRGDDSCCGIYSADSLGVVVRDEQVPRRVDRDAGDESDLGCRRGATVAAKARRPVSGNRGDDARSRVYAPKAFVGRVGVEDVSRRVDADAIGIVELGSGRGPDGAAERE